MTNALKILTKAMENKQSTIRLRLLNLKRRYLQRKIAKAVTKF
jgi:ActR/RegA family two-component response regulator